MPLIAVLLWMATAWAQGSVVWLAGEADPAATAGLQAVPLAALSPDARWSSLDDRALERLAAELEAVRPLILTFDGELEIMARLESAVADVTAVRDDDDRDLLFAALTFQGFAVQRYFQETLGKDPAAVPYRVRIGMTVEVKPWVDAVALDPDRRATRAHIPEEMELRAFDEMRARLLLTPKATVTTSGVTESTELRVDSEMLRPEVGSERRVRVQPGRHRLALWDDGRMITRAMVDLDVNEVYAVERPPSRAELEALADALARGPSSVPLSRAIVAALAQLPVPAHLAVQGRAEPLVYRVDGAWAVRTGGPEAPAAAPLPQPVFAVRVLTGVGWVYDPNFFLNNADEGAPYTRATVNAPAAVVGTAIDLDIGDWVVSVGLDVAMPTGTWHTLRVGQARLRTRAHPWVGAGLQGVPVRLTAGAWLPWHLGIGARGWIPIGRNVEISAIWVQGAGIPRQRTGDAEPFRPGIAHLAAITAGGSFR